MSDWYTCTETAHVWVGFDTHSGSQKSPELLTQQHQKRHPLTRHGPSSSLGEHPLEFVYLRSNYPASCAQKDLYELILYHLACLYPPLICDITKRPLTRHTFLYVHESILLHMGSFPHKYFPEDKLLQIYPLLYIVCSDLI